MREWLEENIRLADIRNDSSYDPYPDWFKGYWKGYLDACLQVQQQLEKPHPTDEEETDARCPHPDQPTPSTQDTDL